VDGIIAMAWEKSNFDLEFDRMFFRFGENIESVEKKLIKRGLTLDKQEIKN
jgi:hypothetical protein